MTTYELGTVAASEALLGDLYLRLRRSLASWSSVTFQTPQPRMGYVGQHLTSVVTGYPGGRSGARGKDLVLPDGRDAEIKTCYRVDQLGSCASCGQVVAAIEFACPICGSDAILRKDDSKWLISPKHEADMATLFEPAAYYLVLFDFEDLADPTVINARIWEVDPEAPGFALCMVDYYFNIRARSKSGAPFNLWPYDPKFQLMKPRLIYHSKIAADDTIDTLVFPRERGAPARYPVAPFPALGRSRIPSPVFAAVGAVFGVEPAGLTRPEILAELQDVREAEGWHDDVLADAIAEALYRPNLHGLESWLPEALQ